MERCRFRRQKEKIASGKSQIAATKQTIDTKQKELDQAKKTYQNGLKELSQGKKQYEQGKAAYDSQYAEAQAKIQAGEEGLVTYRAELDKGWAGYQTLLNTIEALKAQAAGGSGQDPDQENPNQDQELLQKIQVMEAAGAGDQEDTGCKRTGLSDPEGRT